MLLTGGYYTPLKNKDQQKSNRLYIIYGPSIGKEAALSFGIY
jgi:hypothetical protein